MTDTDLIALRFVNSDARPKEALVVCTGPSIAPIMAWYGAYYAGDRYAVYADGVKLAKDHNGELVETPND
ncbi:hypothetical protein [Sphingomonas sp.]|uniref:hypothetical protein n=1 Tax=Sphingomonas sp. TaxID=28214 RepID=UPI003F6F0158